MFAKISILALVIAAATLTLGCGPRYLPLAGHTLQAGENQQHDVVWVSENGEIVYRCSNSSQGPVCVSADMR
ncbi:MAG: hypothetical protein RIF41_06220 [Polyangiaceae bacterium]